MVRRANIAELGRGRSPPLELQEVPGVKLK
jgi:hypothetical protein